MTVKYEFTDGLQTKIIADLPSGSTDQETLYTYGTTKGTSAGDSKISTGHLLQEVEYPDSASASDVVTYAYNAQGEMLYSKDQAGNVTETDYDDGGREEHRRITTLASGFDGAVRRISMGYTSRGQISTVTQYDNATAGSGSVVDEVAYSYDGWGNISKFEQDRNSAVGASGSVDDYEVSYTYAKATSGRNTIRRASATMPSGNVITYDYLSANGNHDDEASRLSTLKDGTLRLVDYSYDGLGQVTVTDHKQPEIMWDMADSGGYVLADVDRFNRVTSNKWTRYAVTDTNLYDVDISYDRNSNISLVEDNVHVGFDAAYTMDDTNRLTRAQEGTWGGSSISSETRDQEWTLSHTGNWDVAKWDLNGDGDFTDTDEYDDTRTHNDVNELTARDTDSNATNDYTHTYDAVGNMTDDGESFEYEYDAFGRLRTVKNQSSTLLAEYKYNGLGFQISEHTDTNENGVVNGDDKWFHSAYDERWRKLATFRESDSDPKEEFVNHQAGIDGNGGSSYINAVVCRYLDANTDWLAASDGVLEQKRYYFQNWRGGVSAITGINGGLWEWAKYTSYGVPFGLPGGDTDSDGDTDATDVTQIQTWIDASTYDVRGDIDLDGDVDSTDKTVVTSYFQGKTAGWDVLSTIRVRHGYAGYAYDLQGLWHARNRVLDSGLGRWVRRDPLGYVDGESLYEYVRSQALVMVDPLGTYSVIAGGGGGQQLFPITSDPAWRRFNEILIDIFFLKLQEDLQEKLDRQRDKRRKAEDYAACVIRANVKIKNKEGCLSAAGADELEQCQEAGWDALDAALEAAHADVEGNKIEKLNIKYNNEKAATAYSEDEAAMVINCMQGSLSSFPGDGGNCSDEFQEAIDDCGSSK